MVSHKVGIFMPYYNMGPFLAEALESLRRQTFTDFVVRIVDDCSPDEASQSVLGQVAESFVQVELESSNLGLVRLANKHMQVLDAEYIMLFSPDDVMEPEFLQVQVEFLDANPEVAAVCTNIQEFGDASSVISYDDEKCALPAMLVENRFSGAALMRKSAFLAAGMHDESSDFFPNLDYELWISMLSKGFELKTIQRSLFKWRVSRQSLSHNVTPIQARTFRSALAAKYPNLFAQYSQFVLNHYFQELERFEQYYFEAEEGHAWLDAQYHSLTALIQELENARSGKFSFFGRH